MNAHGAPLTRFVQADDCHFPPCVWANRLCALPLFAPFRNPKRAGGNGKAKSGRQSRPLFGVGALGSISAEKRNEVSFFFEIFKCMRGNFFGFPSKFFMLLPETKRRKKMNFVSGVTPRPKIGSTAPPQTKKAPVPKKFIFARVKMNAPSGALAKKIVFCRALRNTAVFLAFVFGSPPPISSRLISAHPFPIFSALGGTGKARRPAGGRLAFQGVSFVRLGQQKKTIDKTEILCYDNFTALLQGSPYRKRPCRINSGTAFLFYPPAPLHRGAPRPA